MEQARRLLEAAKGSRFEALLVMAVSTGMRQGELIGLKWQDINFGERSLQIRRTIVYSKKQRCLIETRPKTERSMRKIILPQFVIDALLQHRERLDALRTRYANIWQERDVIFATRTGNFLAAGDLRNSFKKLLKKAGLPTIRFHDVRRFGDCKIALKGQKVRAITF